MYGGYGGTYAEDAEIFAVPPFGPWATLALALLSAPFQAVGLGFLRLGIEFGEDEGVPSCRHSPSAPRNTAQFLQGIPPAVSQCLGLVLLYIGLSLSSLEMMMGASNEGIQEVIVMRKAVLLVQCTCVLQCLAIERYLITGAELPNLQRRVCYMVWVGSSLLEWAAPWPHDDTSQVLQNQRAGCDDGYRALFTFVYVPLWLTCLTFGVLLMNCIDGSKLFLDPDEREDGEEGLEDESDDEDEHRGLRAKNDNSVPHPMTVFRRCCLPIVYGFAMSASSVLFATGWTKVDWRLWAGSGAMLVAAATCCAWHWTQHLKLTLAVWAPLSQCCVTLLRLFQSHLIFRDFQWTREEGFGLLVGKKPGVYCYLLGVQLLLAVLLTFVLTYQWTEWTRSEAFEDQEELDSRHRMQQHPMRFASSGTPIGPTLQRVHTFQRQFTAELPRLPQQVRDGDFSVFLLRWLLLPICFGCYVKGVTSPLYNYSICTPDVQWLNAKDAIEQFQNSTAHSGSHSRGSCIGSTMGFVDSITWLYDNHMPFSAMLAAYRSLIGPPLEFCALLVVLLSQSDGTSEYMLPSGATVPKPVREAMMNWLAGGAASKFATNCFIEILYVTIIQSADPGGNSFEAEFTRGFAYMMMYCVTYGLIVRSLEVKTVEEKAMKGELSTVTKELEIEAENTDEEDERRAEEQRWLVNVLQAIVLIIVVVASMYFSIKTSFIRLDFRYTGETVLQFQPVLLDLWHTLMKVSMPVAVFAAASLVFFLLLRIVTWLLLHTIFVRSSKKEDCSMRSLLSFLESFFKQYTLCHIWAESIILLWFGILTRNRDLYQVCATLPSPPYGLIAILVLGVGVPSLHTMAGRIALMNQSSSTKRFVHELPGGMWVWGLGPIMLFCFWSWVIHRSGPALPPKDYSRDDVNKILFGLIPPLNQKIRSSIPESRGECQELWQLHPNEHPDCVGRAPLVHLVTEFGWDVSVMWATGLNKVVITDMLLERPKWTDPAHTTQEWDVSASFVFTNLKVWVKASKDGEAWVDGNICCNKNFTFKVQASTSCTTDDGFGDIRLSMLHMDHVEMESKVAEWNSPDSQGMIQVDYGDAEDVGDVDLKQVLENFMTGKVGGGKLLMKTSEGPPLDVLEFLRHRLQDAVRLNTRPQRLCPDRGPALPAPTLVALRPRVEVEEVRGGVGGGGEHEPKT